MSTGNNIETEYLELNEKQEWTVHYQVLPNILLFFVCVTFPRKPTSRDEN